MSYICNVMDRIGMAEVRAASMTMHVYGLGSVIAWNWE